ncbi:MAG: aromatic amino acid transport family protein [Nanoarchaeota archaeon]
MLKKRGAPKQYTGFFAKHRLAIATATLMGTIIGAGVLAIPYVVAKSGFLLGLLMILFIGGAFVLLNLSTGEIVLRTKGQHQLTGYVGKYLGPWGKKLMTLSMSLGIYGALTAYLIGEGQVLKALFGGPSIIYSLLFFALVAVIVYRGVKATGKAELIIICLLFVVVFLIGIFSFRQINPANFTTFNPAHFFLPYGVILFAFVGTAAIPELQEELENEKKKMKTALIVGSLIPIVLYIIFTVVVIGLVGLDNFELLQPNERIATVALSAYAHPLLGFLANIFAAFSMLTTFLALGTALTEMYAYDYRLNRKLAFALVMVVPLIIALSGLATFIAILGFIGAVVGGLDGILIVLALWKAKKKGDRKPEYSMKYSHAYGALLVMLFVFGILYKIISSLVLV